MEAADRFEATVSEKGFEVPASHYKDVNLAQNKFESDAIQANIETVTPTDKADGNTMQAKKFLRDIKGTLNNEELKIACDQLIKLIDKGTFTNIPTDVKKIRQQLDKQKITFGNAQQLILNLANKYAVSSFDNIKNNKEKALDILPEIVITETFIK